MYSIYCLTNGKNCYDATSCHLVCQCKTADIALVVFNSLVSCNSNKSLFYKIIKKK